MKFTKMHGIGNDYVYVNGFAERVADPVKVAIAVSDRHFGVGSDGLILIQPSEIADVRMRMFNADGSESEMCGNGVRCVAKYAFDHGLTKNNPLKVQTGRGVLPIAVELVNGKVSLATVDMGEPILESGKVPTILTSLPDNLPAVNYPFDFSTLAVQGVAADWTRRAGVEPGITCVSMGNPHVMIFVKEVAAIPLEQVGPVLERHPAFPKRINVHFVQVVARNEVIMRTWERGSGITLACGTGACAVAVAGVLTKRTDRKILAHLPGGDLSLDWRESDDHVFMTGPATEVFSGEWPE